ncbi:ATP phosphoribosyltransferase regulatory subunit [Sulfurospirillum diekertiae]|uniref:ATP phosphoribosyltransferase regulatory subunit n=1 Tax=Sulfurospirillum diekertiae TaxID=1854492 RepID=A0A1Y0HNW2_9BACT|nr:ATP phosphoribosyltransferase regulatory subunit [Sulfurospirillum diekertiae]ARU49640.1 Histidine--tRNA ligase [Sulfurospirillum diekertiae]ASC94440.1 Histidine--tRNA ligase [Sulfurospirillum diekertiae]ATB70496.1 ATP phosphoribosyltransferase regulatory subunit [Sulfurospirillum diekertiae]
MIYEHEIPTGSKLYFGESAKLKRKIENVASELFYDAGFEEIVTPFFSYHQHKSIDEKELLRFSDEQNHIVSLRADSTMDVVRLITKRVDRTTNHSKWFYIQPVFRYPSHEIHQIGAELIGEENLALSIATSASIFEKFSIKPLLHVSNINIPKMLSQMLNLDLKIFEKGELQKLLALDIPWLTKLTCLQTLEELEAVIDEVPNELRAELEKLKVLSAHISCENIVFSPLYYVKMRYYNALFFRFIYKNFTLGSGGSYDCEGIGSSGFGLYTDDLIEILIKRDGQ